MKEVSVEIYPFEPAIELGLTLACATSPKFWGLIGHAIDHRRLVSPSARLIIEAVTYIAKGTGNGPTRAQVVTQRLANMCDEGKLTYDQLTAAKDYLLEADDAGAIPVEELASVVVPIVRRVHYKEAVAANAAEFGRNGTPEDAARLLERVAKIGVVGRSAASQTLWDMEGLAPSTDERKLVCEIGVPEVDQALGGGLEPCALGLIVAGSGIGKSMALAHVCVHNLWRGRDVFYVTLELSSLRTGQRITRNLVNMDKGEVAIDKAAVYQRLQMLRTSGYGSLEIVEMEPGVTSPADIREKVKETRQLKPWFNPSVFVIDFLDKVRTNQKASLYEDMLATTDGLRALAVENDGWTWTAAQSDRKSTGRPWLDLDAVADSMNKIRSADLVLGMGRTEEDQAAGMIRWAIPKRREGEGAGAHIGPLPWDPDRGRVCVVGDRDYPW